MAKDPDFGGGIPTKLLDVVAGLMSGALPAGVTQADAINVLTHLVWEEHHAANPGSGVIGIWEVSEALKEFDTATKSLKAAARRIPPRPRLHCCYLSRPSTR